MKHVLSVLVENEAGVLTRVSGLFSARGFNIESLTVAPVGDGETSRITLVTTGEDNIIEQIIKQLHKLVPVIQVHDLTDRSHVERELMMVKVDAEREVRAEVLRIADIFRSRVVDATPNTFVVEVTGSSDKLDACLNLLTPLGVVEVVRTGKVAMARGPKRMKEVLPA
ncbi:acetolactate synthase, small subunit [Magnetococcus marinus MC-1]|uniref:Acetolactate synthase small subunit n=1 Tax=Magnetococcus marinus (strain ATCC BAA-1437 / JCM 17883 / MC-1) TaxID=156889 RepID=A0L625_MAGMM|nr:acetolactate synthase small subunit [Magnetococcus marinus]ABK43418.1 acetolactate synthase, small subunit [Magnetococcus marinus MC-1]